jgi:hypothetical protein
MSKLSLVSNNITYSLILLIFKRHFYISLSLFVFEHFIFRNDFEMVWCFFRSSPFSVLCVASIFRTNRWQQFSFGIARFRVPPLL